MVSAGIIFFLCKKMTIVNWEQNICTAAKRVFFVSDRMSDIYIWF